MSIQRTAARLVLGIGVQTPVQQHKVIQNCTMLRHFISFGLKAEAKKRDSSEMIGGQNNVRLGACATWTPDPACWDEGGTTQKVCCGITRAPAIMHLQEVMLWNMRIHDKRAFQILQTVICESRRTFLGWNHSTQRSKV